MAERVSGGKCGEVGNGEEKIDELRFRETRHEHECTNFADDRFLMRLRAENSVVRLLIKAGGV